MKHSLLLLEDEINVGSTVKDRLTIEGYDVIWAHNLAEAQVALESNSFSLALLDVNLPDGSGFDIGRLIRQKRASMAVVFLTAAGTPEDRIHGLELGAEDYIVKPFNFKELLLRIQNVLKRIQFIQDNMKEDFELHIGRATVHFNQYEIVAEKRGMVVSRDEILDVVWSEDEYPTPRTIDNFVLRLRKLIEPDINAPIVIRSVRGIGYLMERESS
jgi:two-component system alkaline phosphatase synthesis response regulator PhoP